MTAALYVAKREREKLSQWRDGYARQFLEIHEKRIGSGKFLFKEVRVTPVHERVEVLPALFSRLLDEEEGFTIKEWEEILRGMKEFHEGHYKSFDDVEDLIAYLRSTEE